MMHKGMRVTGGNMPKELQAQTTELLDRFGEIVEEIALQRGVRKAVVRSRLPCTLIALLDKRHLFIIAQSNAGGMPKTIFAHEAEKEFTTQQAREVGVFDCGLESPFVIAFSNALLTPTYPDREAVIRSIAIAHVDSECERIHVMMNTVQIRPIFGPPAFTAKDKLVFVLMPFTDRLTEIYKSIIQPTIEDIGFACRRADDYKTNKAVMQDIWQAICEARIIIADMTSLNANVMYELGVAHTVGKETILIHQTERERGESSKFPFDLAHIRRIIYDDTATGGKKLGDDLRATIESVVEPVAVSEASIV